VPMQPLSDAECLSVAQVYMRLGSSAAAAELKTTRNHVETRVRRAIERGLISGRRVKCSSLAANADGMVPFKIENGHILIGSDAHYFPGIISTAHRAFIKMCRDVRPCAVIMNGDVFDGSTISRHPRIGWDNKPTVQQELKAVEDRLAEVQAAAGTRNLFWNLGNHDARYETFLAANAPQFQGVDGFTLKSQFPEWKPAWSVWINDCTVVKHRFKSGVHAVHNNAMWSGKNIVTGHLHSLKVSPLTDYNGTRFGVDSGTLAAPYGPQFSDYTELNPVNWRGGFILLTYHNGELLWPQIIHVLDEEAGIVEFGTQVFYV
jgi:hypothetical protein